MKLQFKTQPYQTNAVEAVVDCFAGQPFNDGISYRIDPGLARQMRAEEDGFKNSEIQLPDHIVLGNIKGVQKRQNLSQSSELIKKTSCFNLDVEMETGTGKTYCYIKTMFEMNKRYGWSKFIIVVPSIAIREGVYKSLQITADHFAETYAKKARFFTYNSRRLHEIESFSSDAGINVMVINIQAFNARGADNRRIFEELDDFQSRKPIDVIKRNNPILIIDEPQKMEGKATVDALPEFNPLMILRYSATHKTQHNLVHRLDAVDAYNQKLVKKIEVRGIQPKGLSGTGSYLYLEAVDINKQAPIARLEFETRLKSGEVKKQLRKISLRDNLFDLSNEMDQYRDRYTVTQIDKNNDMIEFANGVVLAAGEALGDVSEGDVRRIQIRETVKAHFEKERQLFSQGIKILSLFFIDEVKKYRDYDQEDEKGVYARIFEEEYENQRQSLLEKLELENSDYVAYIKRIDPAETHNGYFSIDKKTKRLVDPATERSGEAKDADAYDLILKDKERLLSFDEDTRFIFSHSALREGWDNPNVFCMCMLKHSDNEISRRQEVGRGLRLCVTQSGERVDNPAIVHEVNQLTVVASESYQDFVSGLQKEIIESLVSRPRQATKAYFTGKVIQTESGDITITEEMASQIYRYLAKNDYSNDADEIASSYHEAKEREELTALPEDLQPYAEGVFALIDSVFSDAALPKIDNGRAPKTNPLNDNFHRAEFQELWSRINKKAVYTVEFETSELVGKCVAALNTQLRVTPLFYKVETGTQIESISSDEIRGGASFQASSNKTERGSSVNSSVKYDLLGKIAEQTNLTRHTVAQTLQQIEKAIFSQFKENPEHFIAEASRIIREQKSTIIIEKLEYSALDESYDIEIFTANQSRQDLKNASEKLEKHVYDYVVTESKIEKSFVQELDNSEEVVVYAKLPRGFLIPTPVGDYNPDWAISFKEGSVRHIYFIAETKGSMSSMDLRQIEKSKIDCARKYFHELGRQINQDNVKYDVVTDYEKLMEICSRV